ncbi:MAG: DUF4339 domain-containing protein [Verrucomicrobiales bacterium]|nr:DUF4339 domain-containing protein [Verrucomicrobiales bacterium]
MSSTAQVPGEKIFHVLKQGASAPTGPFSKEELENLLTDKRIAPSDYIFFPGLEDWKIISEIFEFKKVASDFAEDGQDLEAVTTGYDLVSGENLPGEVIQYIAVQDLRPSDRIAEILQSMPQSIVLTNHRIAVVTPKLIGDADIVSYRFDDVATVSSQVNRRDGGSLLKIELKSESAAQIAGIPDDQLTKLIDLSAEFRG